MPLKSRDKKTDARGEEVRCYFDGTAGTRFDVIYQEEKRLSQKLVDRFFRDVVHRRFHLTFELCREIEGSRVLDIGCGSGRYAVEFARRGAEVVGLDFSSAMVAMARRAAEEAGVANRCRFEVGNFRDWCEPHHFDICLAIGFFDYVEEPAIFLRKIYSIVKEQVVFSFPIRWTLRSLTRWMRLSLNGCPIYFYNEKEAAQLVEDAGWKFIEINRLSRDYLVYGGTDSNSGN
jgi:magnesium protoporphyrin O-methyltransferase